MKKGYTLIELLIFMAMFSVLLLVFTQIFSLIVDVRLESESTSSVAQDSNYLLNRFKYDISRANSINLPNSVGATDTSLNIVIDGVDHVYALNGGNLLLTVNGTPYQLNSSGTTVSNLTFKRIGNDDGKDTVQLGYTVTSVIQEASGSETKSYQTTVGLR